MGVARESMGNSRGEEAQRYMDLIAGCLGSAGADARLSAIHAAESDDQGASLPVHGIISTVSARLCRQREPANRRIPQLR